MRTLRDDEIASLKNADAVAHLATIDAEGFPHITPMWFLWTDNTIALTSFPGRPHLQRIRANSRVGLVIDAEDDQGAGGHRPNRQIRVVGHASVTADPDGEWTRRIRRKYLDDTISPGAVDQYRGRARELMTIVPVRVYAVASF